MSRYATLGRRRLAAYGGALVVGGLGEGLGVADAKDSQVTIVNLESAFGLTVSQMLRSGGYLEEFGLDAKIINVTDSTKILAALISGSADICGGGGFSGVFPAVEHGAAIKIIGGGENAPLTGFYARNPNIRSTKDLVGKTVGTGAPGALLHELVVALLQKQGVDYRSVNFVNVGASPEVFKAVVAGTVDAGPGDIGYLDELQKYGVHVLSDGIFSDQLPLFTIQAFLASDHMIKAKREMLVRVLAAYAKLYRFIVSPESEAAWVKARAIALGTDRPAQARALWAFLQRPNRLDTHLILSERRTNYIQRLNVETGVQKHILPFGQVADMSLARDALKRLA